MEGWMPKVRLFPQLYRLVANYMFTDDPYSPYYPGDEYVDWVGASIYSYGSVFPWSDNIIAPPGKFDAILNGELRDLFGKEPRTYDIDA